MREPPRGPDTVERQREGRLLGAISHLWTRALPVVLAYHDVVDVDLFRRQMDHLRSEFNPLSLQDLVDAQQSSRPLPPRSVLVTFDDGDRSVYERGLPILAERGLPAILFVVTGVIGTNRPLWFHEVRELLRRGARFPGPGSPTPDEAVRILKGLADSDRIRALEELRAHTSDTVSQSQLTPDELRELDAAGVEIGNHTHTHPCLDRCDENKVVEEIAEAHDALTRWLGHPPRAFAYPNGSPHPRASSTLRQLGYSAGFLFDHQIAPHPFRDPHRISRLRVNSTTSMSRFRSYLNGLHPFLHHAIGRR